MIAAFVQEARDSLSGVVRLASGDPRGLDRFDLTVAGFWRSFLEAAVALPLFAVERIAARIMVSDLDPEGNSLSPLEDLTIYVSGWILATLVLLGACALLRKTDRFAAGVIALNWLTVFTQGAFAAAAVVAAAEPSVFIYAMVSVLMAILVVEYRVLRLALALNMIPAIGVLAAVTLVENMATFLALRTFG